MRIVVHGQQAFGEAVLQRLLERGEDVVAVFCAPEKEGARPDPLRLLAEEKGLPLHQPKSWKTPEAEALMRSYEPDLCVMAYVTLFVPQKVLDIPKLGTIQYHPSLLPRHRGPSSINWPIAMGETRTGLTIFWPDEGLDEGPILLQKEVDIGPDETLGDVYFKKLFPLGVEAMIEAVDLVREGKAPRIPQNHDEATYESWFNKKVARIDWSKPVGEVYNLIRASNPQPGAWTRWRGEELQIYDCEKRENENRGAGPSESPPGTVLAVGDDGILIAATGGAILAKRVRGAGGSKTPAGEFARSAGLHAGERLGD